MKNVINHHGLRYRVIILAISLALLLSVAVGDAAAFTEGCYQHRRTDIPTRMRRSMRADTA